MIDKAAYRMWLSDCEADPMLHTSWESSKHDYRRRAAAAAVAFDILPEPSMTADEYIEWQDKIRGAA